MKEAIVKYQKIINGVYEILKEDFSATTAEDMAKQAQERFLELCEENKNDVRELKKHTFGRIYPSIAIYETLLDRGMGKEEAASYIREFFLRYCAKTVPHLKRIIALPGMAKKIPDLFMKIGISAFPIEAGFEYEFPPKKKNEARFNIVSCPYMKTCQKYGHPELCTVFCDSDDVAYGDMHKDLKWGRTKTIGRGNDCCNFLLEYTK